MLKLLPLLKLSLLQLFSRRLVALLHLLPHRFIGILSGYFLVLPFLLLLELSPFLILPGDHPVLLLLELPVTFRISGVGRVAFNWWKLVGMDCGTPSFVFSARRSALSERDATEVAAIEHRRNLLACETTIGICDKSQLTQSEAADVATIDKEQNQLNCETGAEACDYSLLAPGEAAKVHALQRQHNLLACQTGDELCDESLLTPSQAKQADSIQYARNLAACKSGNGYCDHSLLSPADTKQVVEAERQHDALSCEADHATCSRSLLNNQIDVGGEVSSLLPSQSGPVDPARAGKTQ